MDGYFDYHSATRLKIGLRWFTVPHYNLLMKKSVGEEYHNQFRV